MKIIGYTICMLAFGALSFATPSPEPEQLLGVSVDDSGITFQVASNGCTTRADFSFEVLEVLESLSPMLPALEHHHYITLHRNIPDNCETFVPLGTPIYISFEEMRIIFGKFHVNNPIGGDKFQFLPDRSGIS